MTTEERAAKVLTDDFFEVTIKGKTKKYKIPSIYLRHKMSKYIAKMDIDTSKLEGENIDVVRYASQMNATHGLEVIKIVAIILYGRNFFYAKPFCMWLSNLYVRYKISRMRHELTNEDILSVLLQYIGHIGVVDFIQAMRYLEMMQTCKRV